MRFKVMVVALVVAGLAGLPAAAATKVGSRCAKPGKTTLVGKNRLVCVRSNGSLVWQRRAATPKSATTQAPVPSTAGDKDGQSPEQYLAPSAVGLLPRNCEVVESSTERLTPGWNNLAAAFPMLQDPLRKPGRMKAVLLPIDWVDLPGQPDPVARAQRDMEMYAAWFETVSGGRLAVDWVVVEQWIRMPGSSADHNFAQSNSTSAGDALAQTAVNAADARVDFTDVDVIHMMLPQGQTFIRESVQGFPNTIAGGGLKTNEGRVVSFTIAGQFFDVQGRTYWSYWAHEMGHTLKLAHVGSSRIWSDMSAYELLGSQDGPYRSLGAWLRFLKGWLADDQLWCQTLSSLEPTRLMLVPLDSALAGVKGAMVRLSDTKVLVLDSRRSTPFVSDPATLREGVLAYVVDSTRGNQEEWAKPIYPPGRAQFRVPLAPPLNDAILYPGDEVSTDGVTIRVLTSRDYDTVELRRN